MDFLSTRPDNSYDEKVDELVAEYVERINEGYPLDPRALLAKYPEVGEEDLERLQAFVKIERRANGNTPLGTLGDYTLRRPIGRGGMGVVYEAWENSMDRAVALKVLPLGIAADTRASARFLREAQTAGKLSHPNIVPVYFTGVTEQTPFYVMEYVEGETLAQIVTRLKDAERDVETPFGPKDDIRPGGCLGPRTSQLQRHDRRKGQLVAPCLRGVTLRSDRGQRLYRHGGYSRESHHLHIQALP